MKKKLLALFLILSICTIQAFALTRGDIETRIRRIVNDTESDTTKQIWSDTILDDRIEEAELDIVRETWCLYTRATTTTTASTAEYVLPNDYIAIIRVAIENASTDGQYEKVAFNTIRKLDKDKSTWEGTSAGKPTDYYERRNRVGLHPKPSASYAGTEKVKIDYVEYPDALADDDSVPLNSWRKYYPYHTLIVWYTCSFCFSDIGDNIRAVYYWNMYSIGVEKMRKAINVKPDRTGQSVMDYD